MAVANGGGIVFLQPMADQIAPQKSTIGTIVVTILALVAVQVLQLIPMFGLKTEAALAHTGWNARFSVAAIAVVSWTTSAIAIQLAMLLLPARWSRPLGRDGLVNPFGWAVLGLTALLSYGHASGIGASLQATALIAGTQQGMMLVVASLYLGTAGLIMAAWIVDRFGVGHGFWVALAATAIVDLTAGFMRAVSLLSMHGPLEAFAPFAITAALVAITVLLTTIVVRQGARFEIVAWPLLLLTLFDMAGHRNETPDILTLLMPLTVALIGLSGFSLLRRAGLLRLFLPLVGALSAIALTETYLIGTFSDWVLPLPATLLVASASVLTALWHEWRPSAGSATQTEKSV